MASQYRTIVEVREAQAAAKAAKTPIDNFNPDDYLKHTSAYSAAIAYFQKYGGAFLFENIARSFSGGRPITYEDLPKIARIMQEKGTLIESGTKDNWVSHMHKILYAKRGGGDTLQGYLNSFLPGDSVQLKVKKPAAGAVA